MKGKFIRVLIALVLVLSFGLVTALPAAGVHTPPGTIYVDAAFSGAEDGGVATPFNTIGEAITHASAGDTISVVAGTYTEDLTVNKANLTIQSASGAASTTIQLVTGVGIDIQGGADNFKLGGASGQGFTITPHATDTTFDIQLENAPSGVEISYNTIDTTGTVGQGISIGAAGSTGLTISNNAFTAEVGDISIYGPYHVNLTVSDNTFTGPGNTSNGVAMQFPGVTGTSVISGNTITGYGRGISITSGNGGVSGLTISGNTISGSTNGIDFLEYDPTPTPVLGNITIVTITSNTLSTNVDGIDIVSSNYIDPSQFTVTSNNFVGNTAYGINNQDAETVTAESNWWGDATGPKHSSNSLGTGDEVTNKVDFTPWLDAAYPGGLPVGLVTNTTQNTGHGTIQEAIDAASPGDTLVARDATFTEDLTVNIANLTLRSLNGKAVTTIQLVTGVGIDIQGGADNFKLGGASGQGFTIDDNASTTFNIQLANAPSDVEISYNTIISTSNAGNIVLNVGAAGASGLTVSNNTISTGTGDGAIWGPNVANVTVSNNTLSGGSYGVQFSGVTGTSTISSNTISSFIGSGGIVIGNGAGTSGLTITGNTISSSSNGIYLHDYTAQGTPADMTTVTVTYNTITGSTADAIKIGSGTYVLASNFTIMYNAFIGSTGDGIENLSTEQVTAEWNWWDATTGPDDDDNKNPYFDEAATASADTVSTNVDFTPWMMHTSLASGWNIYSTPIASGTSTDTISEALNFWGADSGSFEVGWYFDGATQNWVQVLDTTPLQPMQAVYLNMTAAATIDVLMSTSNTAPPAITMSQSWNLVGPAQMYTANVTDSLNSAYFGTGAANLVGYSQVLSPSINQSAAWTFIRDGTVTNEDFIPTEGFWVYMVNQGTLGGFTYTPITPLP